MPWEHRSFWIAPLLIAATLAGLALLAYGTGLKHIYRRHLAESRRDRLFVASVGFFVAVGVIRCITVAIHYNVGPFHDVQMRGRHIHHMVWGISLLLLVGYLWLVEIGTGSETSWRWVGRLTSTLFGVAAALTLDEFALWLNLSDVYWQRQGRESYEALALFGALLAIGVFGAPFFRGVAREAVGVPDQNSSH